MAEATGAGANGYVLCRRDLFVGGPAAFFAEHGGKGRGDDLNREPPPLSLPLSVSLWSSFATLLTDKRETRERDRGRGGAGGGDFNVKPNKTIHNQSLVRAEAAKQRKTPQTSWQSCWPL
jgi:hypothetical protein